MDRPYFASRQAYAARFTDAAFWRPYVEAVCERHALPCDEVRAGYPGTHAVFLVDGRYAVKVYTDLFASAGDAATERAVYRLVARSPDLPAPALLAGGDLFPADGGWPWPYIVTSVVPGERYGDARPHLSLAERLGVASALGPILRRIHDLPLPAHGALDRSWSSFLDFLAERRRLCHAAHAGWATLPAHLLAQIDAYLLPSDALADRSQPPRLVHADLTEDHVLGAATDGRWQPSGIIDFGDARTGDRLYELIALHLDVFRCDKRLLRAFMDAYGRDAWPRERFAGRMMSLALLFPFNDLGEVLRTYPSAAISGSLEELASLLWDLDAPGLPGSEPD